MAARTHSPQPTAGAVVTYQPVRCVSPTTLQGVIAPYLRVVVDETASGRELARRCFTALDAQIKDVDSAKALARGGNREALELIRNEDGDNVMTAAARAGDTKKVAILARARFGHLNYDRDGRHCLSIVAAGGHSGLIKTLAPCVSVNQPNRDGRTALHSAIDAGKADSVRALIAQGANLKAQARVTIGDTTLILTPLALAVALGQISCVDAILAKPEPQLVVPVYGNIIHLACLFQKTEMLRHLLVNHSEICTPLLTDASGAGDAPVLTAAAAGSYDILKVFQELQVVNFEATGRGGLTALHLAAREFHENVIRFLVYHYPQLLAVKDASTHRLDPPQYALSLAQQTGNRDYEDMETLLNHLGLLREQGELELPKFTNQPPENIVLRGGGPAGIAYAGVYRYLWEHGASDGELRKAGEPDSDGIPTPSFISGIKRLAGTSAGAIGSVFIALGFTPDEVEVLLGTDILSFISDEDMTEPGKKLLKKLGKKGIPEALADWEDTIVTLIKQTAKGGVSRSWKGAFAKALRFDFAGAGKKLAGGLKDTVEEYPIGLCKGDKFENWMEEQMAAKSGVANLTFAELRAQVSTLGSNCKHVHIYTTLMHPDGSLSIECLNSEFEGWWDNVVVSSAVRASMSIPLAFTPATLKIKPSADEAPVAWEAKGRCLDGGMLMNYGIESFDARKFQTQRPMQAGAEEQHIMNRRSLGVTLFNPEEAEADTVAAAAGEELTALTLAKRVCKIYMGAEDLIRDAMGPWNQHRTIPVNRLGVKMLDFQISPEMKAGLSQSGYEGTANFFS